MGRRWEGWRKEEKKEPQKTIKLCRQINVGRTCEQKGKE
jgi:hypothetical protein